MNVGKSKISKIYRLAVDWLAFAFIVVVDQPIFKSV